MRSVRSRAPSAWSSSCTRRLRRPAFAAPTGAAPADSSVSLSEPTEDRAFEATLRDATFQEGIVDPRSRQRLRPAGDPHRALDPAPLADQRRPAECPQRAARRSSHCCAPVATPSRRSLSSTSPAALPGPFGRPAREHPHRLRFRRRHHRRPVHGVPSGILCGRWWTVLPTLSNRRVRTPSASSPHAAS
jgi:hypothetical protein